MEKLKDHAVKKLFYAGLSQEDFDSIVPDIRRENQMNLKTFSAITCAFLLGMLVLSCFLNAAAANRRLYLTAMLLCAGVFLIACNADRCSKAVLPVATYAYVITMFLFGIFLGTFASPEKQTVTFVAFLLTIPLLFTDRPIKMLVCILVTVILFIPTAIFVKDKSVLVTDIVDVIVFGMLSGVVSTYMMRVKCQRALYARKIAVLSQTDLLTGLHNRNFYEQKLKEFSSQQNGNLSCVYVDANGLHELNDTKGHDAGDKMLQWVGKALREEFGEENAFRIGGDEFVAVITGVGEEALQRKIDRMKETVEQQSYHISVGYAQGNCSEMGVSQLIRQAEERMYADKRDFYQRNAIDRRKRV